MKLLKSVCWTGCVVGALMGLVPGTEVEGATIFFGPTPYLQPSDVPLGFYVGGPNMTAGLETFEDGVLDSGILIDNGTISAPGGMTDSVDADDVVIDGSGTMGRSWFHLDMSNRANSVMISFTAPVSSAGVVWTDGDKQLTDVVFEAFGPGMVSLGTIHAGDLTDNFYNGTTAEDRFFGVRDFNGVIAISLTNVGGMGIELDHIHWERPDDFNQPIPEPASAVLGLIGAAVIAGLGRRSRRTA